MPPLPDLQTASTPAAGGDTGTSPLAAILSGIMPVKSAVDAINQACKQIVQSGMIPGAENVCGQIVAMAQALLPMAVQSSMGPMQGQGGAQPGQAPGQLTAMPPSPAGPQPLGQ